MLHTYSLAMALHAGVGREHQETGAAGMCQAWAAWQGSCRKRLGLESACMVAASCVQLGTGAACSCVAWPGLAPPQMAADLLEPRPEHIFLEVHVLRCQPRQDLLQVADLCPLQDDDQLMLLHQAPQPSDV